VKGSLLGHAAPGAHHFPLLIDVDRLGIEEQLFALPPGLVVAFDRLRIANNFK
jgi:hypothetical protein